MDRRKFLRVSLLGLAGTLLPAPVQAMAPASPAGAALTTHLELTAGRVRKALGPGFSVLRVFEYRGQIFARVSFRGHSFYLKSPDGSTWYTADWSPPYARRAGGEQSHG